MKCAREPRSLTAIHFPLAIRGCTWAVPLPGFIFEFLECAVVTGCQVTLSSGAFRGKNKTQPRAPALLAGEGDPRLRRESQRAGAWLPFSGAPLWLLALRLGKWPTVERRESRGGCPVTLGVPLYPRVLMG